MSETLESRVAALEAWARAHDHDPLPPEPAPEPEPTPEPPPPPAVPSNLQAVGEVRDGRGFITLSWDGPSPLPLFEVASPTGLGVVSSPSVRGPLGALDHTSRYWLVHGGARYDFPPVTLVASGPAPGPAPVPDPDPAPPAALVAHVPFTDAGFRGLRTGDSGIRQWSNVAGAPNRFERVDLDGESWGRASIIGGPHGSSIRAEGIVAPLGRPGESLKLRAGDELWFGVTLLVAPGTTDTGWNTILQWKNDGTGSPPLALQLRSGLVELQAHDAGGRRAGAEPVGAIDAGRPHRYVFGIRFDPRGSVEAWRDGEQTLPPWRPGGGTLYAGRESYFKVGYYRDGAIRETGRIHYRDVRVGRSRADVA